VVWVVNFLLKPLIFHKKKPLRPAAGAQLGKKLIRPPEEFFPSPKECESIVFRRFLQIVDKQDYLTGPTTPIHMGVKLFSWVRRCFVSPNSIKVYNTYRRVQIEGAAFYGRPIRLSR